MSELLTEVRLAIARHVTFIKATLAASESRVERTLAGLARLEQKIAKLEAWVQDPQPVRPPPVPGRGPGRPKGSVDRFPRRRRSAAVQPNGADHSA